MLTTGEIKQVLLDKNNKFCYKVRLPYFESPGQTSQCIVPCYVCYAPGNINAYVVGDKVFVEFLHDRFNTPIIMGKIYRGAEEQSTNAAFNNTLEVTKSATLPQNTTLGNITVEDLNNMKQQIALQGQLIESLINMIDNE